MKPVPVDLYLDYHGRLVKEVGKSIKNTEKRLHDAELCLNLEPRGRQQKEEHEEWKQKMKTLVYDRVEMKFPDLMNVRKEYLAKAIHDDDQHHHDIKVFSRKDRFAIRSQISSVKDRALASIENGLGEFKNQTYKERLAEQKRNAEETKRKLMSEFLRPADGGSEDNSPTNSSNPNKKKNSKNKKNASEELYNPNTKPDSFYQVSFKTFSRDHKSGNGEREQLQRRKDELKRTMTAIKLKPKTDPASSSSSSSSVGSRGSRARTSSLPQYFLDQMQQDDRDGSRSGNNTGRMYDVDVSELEYLASSAPTPAESPKGQQNSYEAMMNRQRVTSFDTTDTDISVDPTLALHEVVSKQKLDQLLQRRGGTILGPNPVAGTSPTAAASTAGGVATGPARRGPGFKVRDYTMAGLTLQPKTSVISYEPVDKDEDPSEEVLDAANKPLDGTSKPIDPGLDPLDGSDALPKKAKEPPKTLDKLFYPNMAHYVMDDKGEFENKHFPNKKRAYTIVPTKPALGSILDSMKSDKSALFKGKSMGTITSMGTGTGMGTGMSKLMSKVMSKEKQEEKEPDPLPDARDPALTSTSFLASRNVKIHDAVDTWYRENNIYCPGVYVYVNVYVK
jgi:hypothetical protein